MSPPGRVDDRSERPVSVGFVGTYPPTRCGIATFGAALRRAIEAPRTGVVALVDVPGITPFGEEVIAEIAPSSPSTRERALAALDEFDVVILQHEFGIYGGPDGSEILELVRRLSAPTIVVLHTVLLSPTRRQREIVERLADTADVLVVQSKAAEATLLGVYVVAPTRLRVIPHGAQPNLTLEPQTDGRARRPTVVTWGLLGPSKGIEYGIEAIATLRDLDPPPRYVVCGQTHPRVVEREGELYRDALLALTTRLGVSDIVEFDDRYVTSATLLELVRGADLVLLPYRSRDQVVSGVLVEAIASGKPVVATRFPHAVELLVEGSGIVVPHENSLAIANALRRLLTEPAVARRAATVARRQADALSWKSVGRGYRELAASVLAEHDARAAGPSQPNGPRSYTSSVHR